MTKATYQTNVRKIEFLINGIRTPENHLEKENKIALIHHMVHIDKVIDQKYKCKNIKVEEKMEILL